MAAVNGQKATTLGKQKIRDARYGALWLIESICAGIQPTAEAGESEGLERGHMDSLSATRALYLALAASNVPFHPLLNLAIEFFRRIRRSFE